MHAGVNPHIVPPAQTSPWSSALTGGITFTSSTSRAGAWAGVLLGMQSAPLLFAAVVVTFPERIHHQFSSFDNPFSRSTTAAYGPALAAVVMWLILVAAGITIAQGQRLGRTLALLGETICLIGLVVAAATSEDTSSNPWITVAILAVLPVVVVILVCLPDTVSD